MPMPSLLVILFHIFAGAVALLSGAAAMTFRKGSRWHRIAGTAFTISMLSMAGTGAFRGFLRGETLNVLAGTFTLYLVSTAWVAARRREGKPGVFDAVALLGALGVAAAGMSLGIAAGTPTGVAKGEPAGAFFVFGAIGLLFAASDIRMFARGGVAGAQRIARHLLRMGLALFIAAASLYPGQAQLFPTAWRQTNLLIVPVVLVIGLTLFWLVRVKSSARRTPRQIPVTGDPSYRSA